MGWAFETGAESEKQGWAANCWTRTPGFSRSGGAGLTKSKNRRCALISLKGFWWIKMSGRDQNISLHPSAPPTSSNIYFVCFCSVYVHLSSRLNAAPSDLVPFPSPSHKYGGTQWRAKCTLPMFRGTLVFAFSSSVPYMLVLAFGCSPSPHLPGNKHPSIQ